jgi:hypothetical protein
VQKSRGKTEVDDFLKNEGRKIAMVLQRQTGDSTWVSAHYSELVEKYPERYVAVHRRQVIGNSEDYEELRSELKRRFENVDDITIEFITTKRLKLLH